LGLKILQFGEALAVVTEDGSPHLMCAYLYELAGLFMRFYEACPVLREDVPEPVRESRLALAELGARTLRLGLDLLRVEVPERMRRSGAQDPNHHPQREQPMISRSTRALLLCILLAGCAASGPKYSTMKGTLAGPDSTHGRVIYYRTYQSFGAGMTQDVQLDD